MGVNLVLRAILERIEAAEWAVLHVILGSDAAPRENLVAKMREVVPDAVVEAAAASRVTADDVVETRLRLKVDSAALGLRGVEPGFYLFHQRQIVAFHPDIPTADELRTGMWVAGGSALAALLLRSPAVAVAGVQMTAALWEIMAAHRAAEMFRTIIGRVRVERFWEGFDWRKFARDLSAGADDAAFRDACATLGIGPDATEQEFKRARRKVAKAEHPDHHPEHEKERAGERMKAINAAADLYARRRGWRRR